MTRSAPSSANKSAVAFPIPDVAPVTIATLFESLPIITSVQGREDRAPTMISCKTDISYRSVRPYDAQAARYRHCFRPSAKGQPTDNRVLRRVLPFHRRAGLPHLYPNIQ